MRDAGPPARSGPEPADCAYEIARELHGILPFGARPDALARCPRLVERVDGAAEPDESRPDDPGERAGSAVVAAVEAFTGPVHLPDHHADPLPPALVRRMLHVLLATRDLGWPGTDAPLSVRRVAAADLFFDTTQTVLSDHDWKGPDGVEFALLTVLAGRVCDGTPPRGPVAAEDDDDHAGDPGGEMLGRLHRVRRPREP